ncbi:MAG TPA: S41 family peptidase [Desulfuromonadales bacterium]|nr:S41 family peptidase [Desulfuromonadales bacterium]
MPTGRIPRSTQIWIIVTVLLAVACASFFLIRLKDQDRRPDAAYLALLKEAYAAVLESHVEKPDSKKLVLSMVNGALAALDPHSAYLPPEPYHEMEIQMSGAFGGVGIELGMKDSKLSVISPIDDTPAFRAGIAANDHIWKIDGTSTQGMNISAAVKRMRGEKGTPVTLTILRNDSPKPLVFNLVRDIIKIKSMKSRMLAPGYGLIRIAQFQERTGAEFKEALATLHSQAGGQLKGLVLDLRYNPGGLLEASAQVVNCFIGDDISKTAIVSIKGRLPETNRVYNATLGTKEPHYPIIVLINGGSASASEIVAGALQDHKRAIIMGTQSFGKGSVQSIYPMKGNAALKLTTARYYTPSGRSIQAKGIVPDIEVAAQKIMPGNVKGEGERLKESDLDRRLAPEGESVAPAPKLPEKQVVKPPVGSHGAGSDTDLQNDYQLKRALELLQSLGLVKERGLGMKN